MTNFSEESIDPTKSFLDILHGLEKSNDAEGRSLDEELSVQTLKELRKLLAEFQLEIRKLFKTSDLNRNNRIRCALLLAKVRRLDAADPFVEMEDIQRLTDIRAEIEEFVVEALREGKIEQDPLQEFLQEGQELHNTIQYLQKNYDELVDSLTEVMGADWTKEQIILQEQSNNETWDRFINVLKETQSHLEKLFVDCINGPEPDLFELYGITNVGVNFNIDEYLQTLELTKEKGPLWKKSLGMYQKSKDQISQLLQFHQEDEKLIVHAHLQAQQGNLFTAQSLLEKATGSFADLPYDEVREEVQRWKQLAIQPLKELTRLLPGIFVPEQSNESLHTLANQFPNIAKEHIHRKFRSIITPMGLLLRSRKMERKVKQFTRFCEDSIEELSTKPESDFHKSISSNWELARENSSKLKEEISKLAWGYFVKKTLILVLFSVSLFSGYNLYHYWKNLPETGILLFTKDISLKESVLSKKNGEILKHWIDPNIKRLELLNLTPDQYNLQVEFENSFPINLPVRVNLGQVHDLTENVLSQMNGMQNRILDFNVPTGSEVKLIHIQSGLEKKYEILAETIPVDLRSCNSIDWNSNTNQMAIADNKGKVVILHTGENIRILGSLFVQGESFEYVRLSDESENTLAASLTNSGVAYVWKVDTGKVLGIFKHPERKVIAISFYEENQSLLTIDDEYELRCWEIESSTLTKSIQLEVEDPYSNWELSKPHPSWHLNLPRGLQKSLYSQSYGVEIVSSQHSRELIVGMLKRDGTICIWNGKNLDTLEKLAETNAGYRTFTIAPSAESLLATHSSGKYVILTVTKNGELNEKTISETNVEMDVARLQLDSTGTYFAAVHSNGEIILQSLKNPVDRQVLTVKTSPDAAISVSPNADAIAFFSSENKVQIWKRNIMQRVHAALGDYELTIANQEGVQLLHENLSVTDGSHQIFDVTDYHQNPPSDNGTPGHPSSGISETGGTSVTEGKKTRSNPSNLLPASTSKTQGSSTTSGQR